jgi:hypothetical protein
MSFTRKTTSKINFYYNVNGCILQKVSEMRDLGVLFDEKLSFSAHINNLYSSCLRLLGFILRTSKDFKNPHSVVLLFNSLIRSRLEHASCVWNPHQLNHKLLLEKLQKKMVKALFYRKQIANPPTEFNFEECCTSMKIFSLKRKRVFNDIKLVLSSFVDQIDTESFMHNFNIYVPCRTTRHMQLFVPTRARTDLGKFSIFNRAINSFNTYCSDIDIFKTSITYKSLLKDALTIFNDKFID